MNSALVLSLASAGGLPAVFRVSRGKIGIDGGASVYDGEWAFVADFLTVSKLLLGQAVLASC